MHIERTSETEFYLRIPHGDELAERDTGQITVPHPLLRQWIRANTKESGVLKRSQDCWVSLLIAPDRVADAERFFTLLRVMGLQALETTDA